MANKQVAPKLEQVAPKPTLSIFDAGALIIGMVIGASIYESPALIAVNAGSASVTMIAWLLGGVMSIVGALCYAELATAYPHPGGNYHYFMRAFGKEIAFLFAWARMTVIQTGSIALLAFVFGNYATQIIPLGNYSPAIYAALSIAILTTINFISVRQGKWTQNLLTAAKVLGLFLVIYAGIAFSSSTPVNSSNIESQGTFGLAMVFVLLTYGGWNEAAYISAEMQDVQRNMTKVLIGSIVTTALIYLLINFAYIKGLGISGMAESKAVAADLMRGAVGEGGAKFVSFLVAISALGGINATIFTGARTNYALGRDFPIFGFLGKWSDRGNTPTNALLVQGAIALTLVFLGALVHEGREGFETMAAYTSPVFWFFFLLSGVALFVLRRKEPNIPRPFSVPGYPLTPLIFCLICAYMLQSSLTYATSISYSIGAIVGVAVLLVGIPLLMLIRRQQSSAR
ncbi:MAG TPA: amino acid permease [Cyanobacteria bacterium UBA11049]|nr:amino acid permease [Cyanobacteria bacterium UBA11049]